VIARVWRGWTTLEDADGYEGHLQPQLLPGLSKVAGFRGSYLLRRVVGEEVEFITIILWDSIAAVRAVAGEDYERAVIPEERKRYLKRFEQRAGHFEVVAQR
jgi:heme-degrading monooxygenase HmoA